MTDPRTVLFSAGTRDGVAWLRRTPAGEVTYQVIPSSEPHPTPHLMACVRALMASPVEPTVLVTPSHLLADTFCTGRPRFIHTPPSWLPWESHAAWHHLCDLCYGGEPMTPAPRWAAARDTPAMLFLYAALSSIGALPPPPDLSAEPWDHWLSRSPNRRRRRS